MNAGEKHSLRAMIEQMHLDGPSNLADEILATIEQVNSLQRPEDDIAIRAAIMTEEITLTEGFSGKVETLHPKVKAKDINNGSFGVQPLYKNCRPTLASTACHTAGALASSMICFDYFVLFRYRAGTPSHTLDRSALAGPAFFLPHFMLVFRQ